MEKKTIKLDKPVIEHIIIATGILKYKDKYLVVKRSEDDDFMPGAWEFPGGNINPGETIEDGLRRELKEEIGFYLYNEEKKVINYSEEIKQKKGKITHVIELDFLINCINDNFPIKLSDEHYDYQWVEKDSDLLDEFIKNKIKDI